MSSPRKGLRGARVLVGVSGGIAAYKAVELCRVLAKAGARVQVAMTRSAQEFIGPLTFQTVTGMPVATRLFDLTQESEIGHIQLGTEHDLVILAPATADLIARLAAGRADDIVTTAALVTRAPMLIAPAMNVNMWEHPFTQDNVARLTGLGRVHFVGPGEGFLACRMVGPGRLADPEDIAEAATRLVTPADLGGKKVLVTAGPTREDIDPVRFVSNRSTGKMGYAIARAAVMRGAEVTLVTGPSHLAPPAGVALVSVISAGQMRAEVTARATNTDVVVMAAAVADYRPARAHERKLKKEDGGLALELERTTDILAELGQLEADDRPFLVGFAAETHDLDRHAHAKLAKKGCDLIVANDVSRTDAGFATDDTEVTIFGPGTHRQPLEHASKHDIAHGIWDRVLAVMRPEVPASDGGKR